MKNITNFKKAFSIFSRNIVVNNEAVSTFYLAAKPARCQFFTETHFAQILYLNVTLFVAQIRSLSASNTRYNFPFRAESGLFVLSVF